MGRALQLEWCEPEKEYIQTSKSYKQISEQFNIPLTQVEKFGREHHWVKKRSDYREKLLRKATNKLAEKGAQQLVAIADAAAAAVGTFKEMFETPHQFNRYIVTDTAEDGTIITTEQEFQRIDAKALRDAAAALKDITRIVRDVYNIPTLQEQQNLELSKARLELDREKAHKEDEGDSTIKVVFENDD